GGFMESLTEWSLGMDERVEHVTGAVVKGWLEQGPAAYGGALYGAPRPRFEDDDDSVMDLDDDDDDDDDDYSGYDDDDFGDDDTFDDEDFDDLDDFEDEDSDDEEY